LQEENTIPLCSNFSDGLHDYDQCPKLDENTHKRMPNVLYSHRVD